MCSQAKGLGILTTLFRADVCMYKRRRQAEETFAISLDQTIWEQMIGTPKKLCMLELLTDWILPDEVIM